MVRSIVFLLLCIVINIRVNGQNQVWSFQQCLDSALRKNITINQSILTNELNKVSLAQAKAGRIPSLSASANESFNAGKTIDPTENTYVDQTFHSTNVGISSSYNLFNGLQNNRNIQQYKSNIKAGEYDIEKIRNDITISVTNAYLQVLFYYEILSTAQAQVEATQAQVDRTEKMVNAGKLAESNLLQIKSQLSTDKLSLINAENQLSLAKVDLMQLMEIPVTGNFEVAVPELEEPAVLQTGTSEDNFQKALVTQPQIAGSAMKTEAVNWSYKAYQGARYPRLNMGVGISSNYASSRTKGGVNPENYPFFEQMWNNLGENISLSLSIPIYSNRQIKSNIDRARINLMNQKLTEQNTRNQLRKTIEQLTTDLKSAARKYEATQEQLQSSELTYKNSESKYNVGMINATDYLIEKNNYVKAQSGMIQARYDLIFKGKILDFYLGKGITL